VPFEVSPAAEQDLDFAITSVSTTGQAAPATPGGFIQFRLNGVDLGADDIAVIDFISPGAG
jgi:hypothetical protein